MRGERETGKQQSKGSQKKEDANERRCRREGERSMQERKCGPQKPTTVNSCDGDVTTWGDAAGARPCASTKASGYFIVLVSIYSDKQRHGLPIACMHHAAAASCAARGLGKPLSVGPTSIIDKTSRQMIRPLLRLCSRCIHRTQETTEMVCHEFAR